MFKTMKASRITGFLLLSIFVLALLVSVFLTSINHHIWFLPILIVFTIGCLYAMMRVFLEETLRQPLFELFTKQNLYLAISVFAGAILTYVLHVHIFFLCAVLSAGLVGILAALFVKKFQVPIYCGAFVGMSSPALLGALPFLLASLLASIIYVLAQHIFNGYGGKLGTIAFSGALILAFLRGTLGIGDTAFTNPQAFFIILTSIGAAWLTYFINHRLKEGPVLASAAVGFFIGALFIALSHPFGVILSVVVIGASFVGMSGVNRYETQRSMLVTGLFFGLIFVYSAPYFGGAGGKLGTIAFTSVLGVKGLVMLVGNIVKHPIKC